MGANAETGPDGIQIITVRKARESMKTVDSIKGTDAINEYVAKCMGLPRDDLHDEDAALLNDYLKRLRIEMITPTLPPNQYLEKARGEKMSLKHEAKARKKEQEQIALKKG